MSGQFRGYISREMLDDTRRRSFRKGFWLGFLAFPTFIVVLVGLHGFYNGFLG